MWGCLFYCSVKFYSPTGGMLAEFKFSECAPPPYRSTHEVRVVMREAIPRHLQQQLPPGTVHYDANVTDVSANSTGDLPSSTCAVHATLPYSCMWVCRACDLGLIGTLLNIMPILG